MRTFCFVCWNRTKMCFLYYRKDSVKTELFQLVLQKPRTTADYDAHVPSSWLERWAGITGAAGAILGGCEFHLPTLCTTRCWSEPPLSDGRGRWLLPGASSSCCSLGFCSAEKVHFVFYLIGWDLVGLWLLSFNLNPEMMCFLFLDIFIWAAHCRAP